MAKKKTLLDHRTIEEKSTGNSLSNKNKKKDWPYRRRKAQTSDRERRRGKIAAPQRGGKEQARDRKRRRASARET